MLHGGQDGALEQYNLGQPYCSITRNTRARATALANAAVSPVIFGDGEVLTVNIDNVRTLSGVVRAQLDRRRGDAV